MEAFRRLVVVTTLLAASPVVHAQSTLPTLTRALPAQNLAAGGAIVTIDLRNYFGVPGVTGQVAQFDTVLGKFNIELFASDAPLSVSNFLSYVADGSYANTFIHRSTPLSSGGANRIVQGGGYTPPNGTSIARKAPIPLEYKLPNARGTLAFARSTELNSATSEWFFNVDDNTSVLDSSHAGGYAVFARVLGSGMSVIDAIAAVPTFNAGTGTAFETLPLRNVTANQATIELANFILINSVTVVPVYPTDNVSTAVLGFAVANNNSAVVSATLSGSTLTLTGLGKGSATISVRAADVNGNAISGAFNVTVTNPTIYSQPVSQDIATGSTAVFNVTASGVPAPTYQWKFNGVDISGATSSRLVLPRGSAQAGNYSVVVSNSSGSVTSNNAVLTLNNTADVGRLANLSVLAGLSAAVPEFTVATVIGGGSSGTKPMLVRAGGPTLGLPPFSIFGVVNDTKLELYTGSTLTNFNDNWGVNGSASLAAVFASVGAYAYAAPDSKDSALYIPAAAPGSYSVKVAGVNGATGLILAEIYDATPANSFSAATHRFQDVSVLKQIDSTESLTVGFNIGGSTARTVLVRAAGPALGDLGVGGTMPDPQLDLYSGQTVLVSNDNWGGDAAVSAVFTSVGAFGFTKPASKDAAIVATLAPGSYTAVVKGVSGSSGQVIVEVYEVP